MCSIIWAIFAGRLVRDRSEVEFNRYGTIIFQIIEGQDRPFLLRRRDGVTCRFRAEFTGWCAEPRSGTVLAQGIAMCATGVRLCRA